MSPPLPLDFVVVRGADDVVHFEAGQATLGPRPGARLVLHAGLDAAALATWRSTGTPCVGAERALALVAPAASVDGAACARELGEAWVRAVRALRPESEALRRAAALLPDDDAALRSLLQRALAELAMAHLGTARPGARAAAPAPATAEPHGPPFAGFAQPPHAALDAAFEHLRRVAPSERPFEPRTAQFEMAHAVLDALLAHRDLVVEAGTGIGKTLAYALPAIILAAQRGDRIVLSTHTRTLQHQLVARDLPWLWHVLGLATVARADGGAIGLRFAKLLGRENYVCRTALTQAARAATGARFDLARALVWSLGDAGGELAEIAPFVDESLCREIASRRETCGGRACRSEPPCPVYAAREAARKADLVVVNHALLFSDAISDNAILGRAGGLVLDEAHHLDAVATEHLSIRIGRAQADALVAPLARLDPRGGEDAPAPRARAAGRAVAAARAALSTLLDALGPSLPVVTSGAATRSRQRYRDGDEVFAPVRAELHAAGTALDGATAEIESLRADPGAVGEDAAGAVDAIAAALAETRAALDFVAAAGDENWAFALGLDARGVHEIVAMPLDVAPAVRRLLGGGGAVYTSATLGTGDSVEAFVRRVGLPESTPARILPSPFDYASQCFVAQAQHLPEYDTPQYVPEAARLLAGVVQRTRRRTLVLCTAHGMVRRLHAALWREMGPRAPVLGQDVSGSRAELARRFAATPGAVLVGTASFWEGVDFPGDALEVLAIGKLPFRPPDDPLVEARSERLAARGDDPFGDYLLPDAVLRFRQGFGRLVRTQRDRGVVLLLDSRLGDRNYGGAFRRALPVAPVTFHDDDTLIRAVGDWFDRQGAHPAQEAP